MGVVEKKTPTKPPILWGLKSSSTKSLKPFFVNSLQLQTILKNCKISSSCPFPRIHLSITSLLLRFTRPHKPIHPLHQMTFIPSFLERFLPSYKFQKYNSKTINITFHWSNHGRWILGGHVTEFAQITVFKWTIFGITAPTR